MATFRTSRPGSAADPSLPHLILIGLPGSGKSTVGARLARELGRSFLDFDVEITRREGMTVSELFGQRGELAFRELEHALTRELQSFGNMVLSPGGGWVTRPDNVALLCPPSRLVYLKLRPAAALRRMGSGAAARPLLSRPDPLGELERLYAARRAVYESADLVVDVEGIDVEEVARRIAARL
jgi:shikimate kinase